MASDTATDRGLLLERGLRLALRCGSRMPLRLTRPLGRQVGPVAFHLVARDRERARSHVGIAFPELDERDRRSLLQAYARHFGEMLAEVVWLWRASGQDVLRLCTMSGTEHLWRALDAGQGAVMVTAHCGNWELLNARLCAGGIPMTVAVRALDDPRLDRIITTVRTRFGGEVAPRGEDAGSTLLAALRRNRIVGLLVDQDIRDVPGVFVRFFGGQAWTPLGAAALAIRARCPVIPTFTHRRPDGSHHAEVHPPLPVPRGGELRDRIIELTQAATSLIERQVRSHPEQWVWMHRRWRTQPQDD